MSSLELLKARKDLLSNLYSPFIAGSEKGVEKTSGLNLFMTLFGGIGPLSVDLEDEIALEKCSPIPEKFAQKKDGKFYVKIKDIEKYSKTDVSQENLVLFEQNIITPLKEKIKSNQEVNGNIGKGTMLLGLMMTIGGVVLVGTTALIAGGMGMSLWQVGKSAYGMYNAKAKLEGAEDVAKEINKIDAEMSEIGKQQSAESENKKQLDALRSVNKEKEAAIIIANKNQDIANKNQEINAVKKVQEEQMNEMNKSYSEKMQEMQRQVEKLKVEKDIEIKNTNKQPQPVLSGGFYNPNSQPMHQSQPAYQQPVYQTPPSQLTAQYSQQQPAYQQPMHQSQPVYQQPVYQTPPSQLTAQYSQQQPAAYQQPMHQSQVPITSNPSNLQESISTALPNSNSPQVQSQSKSTSPVVSNFQLQSTSTSFSEPNTAPVKQSPQKANPTAAVNPPIRSGEIENNPLSTSVSPYNTNSPSVLRKTNSASNLTTAVTESKLP